MPDNAHQKRFDVIIVMGAAVWKGGQPSPALKRRVAHAVVLMKKNRADYLVVTGGLGAYPPTEARVMREMAIEAGIPPRSIVMEEKGTSTFKSVVNCVKIMAGRNWTNAILVSDPYHLWRCMFLLRRFGVQAVGSAAPGGRRANPLWKWGYYYMREFIALPWYLVLVVTEKWFGNAGCS